MSDANRGAIQNIQFLRGFSALLVVLFHLGPIYEPLGVPQFGGGGVDVFFVISGFLMAYTNNADSISGAAFFKNRIRRIVPLYWLITLFVFCLALMTTGLMKSVHTSWTELLQSLFFISFTRDGALAGPVLFLGWTLNYEMLFYLIFATGLLLPRRLGLQFTMLSITALIAAGWIFDLHSPLAKFYTDPIMFEFCFGMGLAIIHDRIPRDVSHAVKCAVLALASLGVFLVIFIPVFWRDVARAFLSGSPALLVVGTAIALEKWNWRITSKLALLLGAASYSLYLTHIFVTEFAIKIFYVLKPGDMTALLLVGAATATACGASLLVYQYIERPLQRMKLGFARTTLKK